MNNLQKLYQTIFEAGLINNSFDDFSKAMSSEDYQKKVFDVITQQGFFSQDFNAFKSAYSNRALRDIRPGEAGYEQFGKKSQQINPALISEEDLTLAEQLTNVGKNLSPTWQNYLDMFVVGSSDVIQNLFGDEAAYNALSPVAFGEFAESYLSFGPFNSRHSKKAYRVKSYYDTNTNELVKFNEEAYDKDGLDAIENDKYFELAKQYKEKKGGVKLFDARTNKPFKETYAAEVEAQMAVINKRFSELNPVTDPGVTGFTDALKKGELDDVLATAASFITDMSAQMVAARATKGKSMAAIMYGNSWKTYNDEKSKALYGEDDPDRVKKLIESGQENTAIPATLGAVGYALERFGMEQITTAMLRKASKGAGTTVMKAMAVEGGTEWLQALTEKFNKSLGEQKSAIEASQDVADYMFTEEAADAFFAGLIGGGTMSASGQAVQAAFRRDETSNQFVNQKLKDLAKFDEYRARTFDKKQRKQYDKAMKQTVEEIKDHLKRNKKVSDYLDQSQIDSLVDILDQNTNTKKEIDNVIKLFNKGLISANEFTAEKAILEKKEAEQKEAINKIKNDANMSLVMQDLDASGKLIKDLNILEQRVFKNEAEFLEALKEEYLAQGKTEKEFKEDTEGYSIDGLKVGNVLFVNAQVAAEKNRFGTGTHELLHGVLKATLQSKDGTGNLSTEGERIVQDFINSLSSRELNIIEQQLEDGNYKVNKDGTQKEFKEYGEEYLNFYAQGAKEDAFTLNAVEKAGKKIASIFNSKTDFKKIGFKDGDQVKNFLNAFVADSKEGIYRQEFVEMAKESEQIEDAVIKKSAGRLSEKASEIQKKADDIGKKAKNKAEYDAGVNVEAYDFYIGKDGKKGALDTLIKAKLAKPKKNKEGKVIFEGISNLDSPDANVSGVRLADYIESVKEKMIPEILGFNPDLETTDQGKFGLSGHVNFRLDKRMGDVLDSAKKTVTGRSLDAPIDDSGRTAAELVEGEADSRLARLEEENLGFLYINAENRLQETEEDKNVLKSRYRHKLRNNDGSKLIGETQVESIREGVRTALRKLKDDVTSDKFLLNFENMVKKTMKNIVQGAIGTKATYRQFVLNNFENIIDFSTVQDLVAMERLVGKGKLKDGKKIFTVPIRRLTKQEDIQKAIDQGKLPVDAINKSEEGVFLSEKRMPSKEELEAFFFGVNMQEVLGYELGASTLGTRKDGLSRMIVTELAQDATMETLQEPSVAEEILSTSPDLTIDIITRSVASKVNRSPDLKFSKSLDEIMNDTTQTPNVRKGAEVLVKEGYQSPEWIKFMNDPKVESKIKLELTINYLQRDSENWYLVKKMKGMPARLKKMKGKTHQKFEKIAQQVLADILRPEGYSVGHLTEKNNAPDVRIYRANNSKFEIGVEVKGTTSRGSQKNFNSKKGKGFGRDNTTDDFYSDNAKQKVDKLLEKANKQVDKIYQFLGVKPEYNSNNNLVITQDQKNKIKEKGLHLNKNFVEFITTLDFEIMYLNKKGKNGIVRPSHYLQLGVAGMFQMGQLNPLNIVDIKRFADQNVDIPITVRFDFSSPLADGRVRLYVKVEPQLDSRFFKAQDINLFNLNSPNLNVKHSKSVKLGVAENIVKASDNARLVSYSKTKKGASIFDFDETVGISENFIIATKEGVTKKISSEEWPFVGEDLANQGYKFDFTDFNRVTKGKPGPLLPKMKNQIKKYGPDNVFILTARAPESAEAIHAWLKSEGVNIPLKNITGLGNSTGEAKAMWVLDKYANEGYNDMYFVDDAITNVQAVQNVFDQLDVKGKSVRAIPDITKQKIKFSKTELSSTVNSPQYKQFKNSIKDRVLYHGGSETINTIRDNNAVWFYLDDADAAQMWGDGEVYSVKASDIQDMVIIPDLNDVSTFTEHIQEKFNLDNKAYDVRDIMSHPKADEIIKEWIEWSAENNMEYDLGYNLYEKGKVTNGAAVTVLGVIPKNKIQQISPKFSKSSLRGDKAVKNVFNQLDIKGKSVQAKMKFSKTKKQNFDSILKRNLGIDKEIDPARAKIIGAKKGSKEFFIAPGADDFQGLMLRLAGKGAQGDSDVKFFKQVFFDPFNRAYRKLNSIQYNMMESYAQIRKEHKDIIKKLKKKIDNEFTNEDAIRIYLWDLQDLDVPGLTTTERKAIASKVANDADMVQYALKVRKSLQIEGDQYLAPTDTWTASSIKGDMYNSLNKVHRDGALEEWQENINELLDNEAQMAKLEAAMGADYVESLKDMLYRMRTGKNRPSGQNASTNKALNWLQGSVGAIMFFNMRSAVLQTISTVNFINHTDNNIFAFSKAIANVPQFAKDFKMLFNSPQLKVRRSGLQQDIQTADLADSLSRGGGAANALAYLLKIGFTPTQVADSFAIAFGGATFYRNRVKSLMKQGMTQDQAESQAMIDFQDITEESQQSSRPDRISKQQASPVGRLLLAFQNTPLQYNRIIKKAVTNIANKRGNIRDHLSRIAYYGAVQSLIFYSLQQALFAEDEPEEDQVPGSVKKQYKAGIKDGSINRFQYPSVSFYYADVKNKQKKESLANSMADGWLRGSGVKGAMVSTFKNVVKSFMKESDKGYKADYFNTFVEVLNLSPQIGSKARKIKRATDTYKYNKDVMAEIGAFDIDNPVYPMTTSLIEGTTNAPVHRIYTKLDNLKEAFNEDNTAMQRTFVALGWNQWQMGIDTYKDVREAKEKIKEEKKAKKKQCRRILSNGKRCSIRTTNKSQLCYHHN